jgi:hypothetical protein
MHVLEQPLVLDLVLQYAGPDQWLFLGAVSKAWAALYTSVPHKHPARRQRDLPTSVLHVKATSFGEAASSLARALHACDCDVQDRQTATVEPSGSSMWLQPRLDLGQSY